MDEVKIGVDPHQLSNTIEVVDEDATLLASGRFGTDNAGHALAWLPTLSMTTGSPATTARKYKRSTDRVRCCTIPRQFHPEGSTGAAAPHRSVLPRHPARGLAPAGGSA